MKIPRRRVLPGEEVAQKDDTTPEVEAGTEPRAYRRTTVTVERETLSVFTRRAVAEPVAGTVPEASPETPGNFMKDKLPEGKLTGGKS